MITQVFPAIPPNSFSLFRRASIRHLINVKEDDTVLDLGSGSGLDLFLAAGKVGQNGRVIGVDMTQDMIDKANQNIKQAGATNIEARLGIMENLPVDDNSIDWVISNCVINLSSDKDKVFEEIFRVLKPGGQMLISDIVTRGEMPSKLRNDALAWAGCLAGALDEKVYLQKIAGAGLTGVEIVGRVDYDRNQLNGFVSGCCSDGGCTISEETIELMNGKISSVKVFAQKPSG